MATDRFYIGPYDENSGQQTNYKPFLIPDNAFEELTNAYVFRGRVRKRFGSRWLSTTALQSRLRIQVGVTAGGTFAGNVRGLILDAGMPSAVGQSFSVLGIVFTVFNPAAGVQQMLRSDGSGAAATYDLGTTAFNIVGTGAPDGTPVFFYPGFPVMGLQTFEQNSINNEFVVAFDTRYAYRFIGTPLNNGWVRLNTETTPGAAVWTGSNSQFFWATTWTGVNASDKVFFVTNFNNAETHFMRFIDSTALSWTNFSPLITATDSLFCARIIVPFKNRLVAFNTWEGLNFGASLNFVNRCRYSQIGSPLDVNAWKQDIPGRGNAIDAPITESIVTVEFVRDRLIVFFERSTWELVYTGNQAYPFSWQQINTELGAESTFSIVPFDKVALGVGNVGIHACNGANVERIDDKIPQAVFDIHNIDSGVNRVYGIRDYFVEMVYWTFPSIDASATFPFPNRVLIYNYKTGTWAFNIDSITVFGYFQSLTGILWSDTTVTWDDDVVWGGGSTTALFQAVVAGNQQGYTFFCDADVTTNAAVLQITNIITTPLTQLTIIDHNLRQSEYIFIQGATYSDASNGLNGQIYQVISVIDSNNIDIGPYPQAAFTGTYNGGGLVSRVSNINIKTKEYNFYAKQGRNAYVSKIDFMVDRTNAGQIEVDYFVSTALTPLLPDSALTGALLGTGTLETSAYPSVPFEANATRVWHPVYLQADGEVIQLQLTMNDAQMRNTAVRLSGFQMHSFIVSATPSASRLS